MTTRRMTSREMALETEGRWLYVRCRRAHPVRDMVWEAAAVVSVWAVLMFCAVAWGNGGMP